MLSSRVFLVLLTAVAFIDTGFQVKVSALQCKCGEQNIVSNDCKIKNKQWTMECKHGEDVCMNIETLGGNFSLDQEKDFLYQGCWRSPSHGKGADCSERDKHLKEDLNKNLTWPSWVCYCNSDMCNGDEILNDENNKNSGKLNSNVWSMALIALIGIFVYIQSM